MTIPKGSLDHQVRETLDGREDEFDVDGIVDEIREAYNLVDADPIDVIPGEAYWTIVQRHAVQDWYFTFGVGHQLYPKKYVKIHGTHEGARKIMFEVFGRNWSHQYDEAGKVKSIDRYGLTELQ